jgi:hypothetical protein
MDRYLIESPHESKTCIPMLRQVTAMGYLNNFDWGCKAGVHVGWAIIEAENEAQAQMAVPQLVRDQARITRLNKFSPEEVESLHG